MKSLLSFCHFVIPSVNTPTAAIFNPRNAFQWEGSCITVENPVGLIVAFNSSKSVSRWPL